MLLTGALAERMQQSSNAAKAAMAPDAASFREKIIFFPRNANVSEALETALDRFGIVEGVVDGGDNVEDKMAKRRSVRIRYCLTARTEDQPEAGRAAPIFCC